MNIKSIPQYFILDNSILPNYGYLHNTLLKYNSTIFKQQLTNISTVLNNTGNTTQLLTSFNALDVAQQKVLLSSKLLTEEQKSQCATMVALSSVNSKYTAEQLTRVAGVSAETLANWGLADSTDSLTIAELAELAVSDKQAKNVLDKIIAQNAQSVANGEVTASNIALASSEGGVTLATGAFTTAIKANISAMKTWLLTTPAGWLTMLVGGIFLAVKAYDALTVSVEEQKEKMEESLSAYEDAKSELSSITTELETQTQAMDELLAKDKLTFAEKGQLEELQAITRELRIQKDLAEEEEGRTKKEVATDASDLFKKQFGEYDISESAINEYQNDANITGNNAILISDDNDISAMIAGYKQFNELLDEAYGSGSQEDIDHFKTLTSDLYDSIFAKASDLQEQQSNISKYYEDIKNIPYEDLTPDQQEIVDSYNAISNAIALIYKQLKPDTWNSMQVDNIFSTDGIEKTKDELVAMAQSGELTPETIKGYTNLNNALGETTLSAQDLCDELYAIADAQGKIQGSILNKTDILSISATVDQLNTQLKPAMESLASAWKDIFTEDGMALEDINILSVADTIKSKLDELAKIDGITVDYSSFEDFIRILEDTSSTEEDVKNGFNKLAQSIVLAGVSGVEDFETLKSALGDLGVVNDEIVAFEALTRNTDALKTAGLDLVNATDEQIRKFTEETVAAENVEQALAILMYRKELLSLEKMSTLQEITNLKNLAISAGYTGEVIDQLTQIEIIYQKIASGVLGTNNQEVAMAMEEARRLQKSIQESLANVNFMPEVDMTNVNKGGSSGAKKTAETIDWIETLLSRIQRTITNLGKTVSATYKGWSKRNNALAKEMKEINKEINAQATAYDTYMAKANSVPLPDEYKKLVRNGDFSFSEIKDETLKKNIDLYRQWYEKALKCSDAIEDLRANLAELAKTKFDNVSKQYDNQMLMIDHNIQMLQGFVEQSESAGYMASEVYYQAMTEKQQENIAQLQNKYSSLLSTFDESVKNGSIEKYSEEWYNMLGDINDVEKALQSANTQLIEFNQTLQQLSWSVFDRIRDSVGSINTEADFLIELLSRSDLFTEAGQMTNEGLAVQGLHAVNYNTYMEQSLAYAEEIKKINEEIAKDPYDLELIDRKNELLELQQEAIANANSEKDAIQSLIKDGYDKMLSSLDKLIEKQKKFLNDQKSLYDYQNSISDQTSNIASLRKQLQAYSGDNSESAKSTIQKLNVSLTKAEKDLRQSEYEKYISDQEELLDSLYSDTEQWINERLDDIDGLIIKAVDATNKNAETISDTINSAADSYSVKLSDKMTAIWDSQENAINGINTVVSIYGDIAHDDITSVGSNITNAINGGNTNVISAIDSVKTSMNQMISALNTIANTNKNSISQSQNNVINNQPNNTPSSSNNNSNGNGGSNANNGTTSGKVKGYKGYLGTEFIGTYPTKPMAELELKKAIERRVEQAAMDEYNRAIKAGYSPQDAGRSAENTKAGYSAQLYALKKIVAYASGTKNAKRGIGLVGEEENEIIFDKNGRAVLTLLPQLYDFKGGEQVLNGSDTKKLLNNVPTNFANSLSRSGNNVTNNVDNIEIVVKANNAEEFVTSLKSAIKNDPQCRKLIQCITVDELVGKGGLKRNNF